MTGRSGAGAWRGVIEEYREFLPVTEATPVVTLVEGGTPLLPAPRLSARVGARVLLKVEGANPTGSFKDRGMTVAISKAAEEGAKAVVCASTGNTSASAAAFAARAGLTCAVLIPEGHIALGKLAQALIHGARVLQVRGNFDQSLAIVRELGERAPVTVVNSVNPVVDNLQYAQTTINGVPFNAQQFQIDHPESVAFAEANASWLKVLQEPSVAPVVAALNANLTPANLAAFEKAVPASVAAKTIANAATLKKLVVPYEAQLGYLSAHQNQLTNLLGGVAKSPKQWQDWFWVCLVGMVAFIPTIWLNRGRWSPKRAREDEAKHEADVEAELKTLVGASA